MEGWDMGLYGSLTTLWLLKPLAWTFAKSKNWLKKFLSDFWRLYANKLISPERIWLHKFYWIFFFYLLLIILSGDYKWIILLTSSGNLLPNMLHEYWKLMGPFVPWPGCEILKKTNFYLWWFSLLFVFCFIDFYFIFNIPFFLLDLLFFY